MRQNLIKAKVIILLQFPKSEETEENIIYFLAQVPKLGPSLSLCIANITYNHLLPCNKSHDHRQTQTERVSS